MPRYTRPSAVDAIRSSSARRHLPPGCRDLTRASSNTARRVWNLARPGKRRALPQFNRHSIECGLDIVRQRPAQRFVIEVRVEIGENGAARMQALNPFAGVFHGEMTRV